jgi:hypothetical protein
VCTDDPTGDLAALGLGCDLLVNMGCGTDLSTLKPELPAGALVKIGCPVSCGACDDPIVVAAIQSRPQTKTGAVGCNVTSSIITDETVVLECPCTGTPCPPGSEDADTCTASYKIMPDWILADLLLQSSFRDLPIETAKGILRGAEIFSSTETLMATEVVPYDLFKCASVSLLCYLARFVRGASD